MLVIVEFMEATLNIRVVQSFATDLAADLSQTARWGKWLATSNISKAKLVSFRHLLSPRVSVI